MLLHEWLNLRDVWCTLYNRGVTRRRHGEPRNTTYTTASDYNQAEYNSEFGWSGWSKKKDKLSSKLGGGGGGGGGWEM